MAGGAQISWYLHVIFIDSRAVCHYDECGALRSLPQGRRLWGEDELNFPGKRREYLRKVRLHGRDILSAPRMQKERAHIQHGRVSVYGHSILVAGICLWLAAGLRLRVDERALVRGALLHDYFLYDWHIPGEDHRLHGFRHPRRAMENAVRDFDVAPLEQDMILRHMFPLTPIPPRHREGWLLVAADKISTVYEFFS